MTSRVKNRNRVSLNNGTVDRDATTGTDIVNWRTLKANTVGSFNVSTAGGASLLEGGALTDPGPVVRVRSLVAGNNISFVVDNDTITINGTAGSGGTATQIEAFGGATSVLRFGNDLAVGPLFALRSLRGGNNITLTEAADTITIDGVATVGTATTTTLRSEGTGTSLLQGGVEEISAAAINLKTLVAGDNVTITSNGSGSLVIASSVGGGGVGALTEFRAPTGTGGATLLEGIGTTLDTNPIIDLKSLSAGANITLTTTDDVITINASGAGGGTVTTVNAVGGETSLLEGGIPSDPGPNVNLRSLVAGENVVIQEIEPGSLTISVPSAGTGSVQNKVVLEAARAGYYDVGLLTLNLFAEGYATFADVSNGNLTNVNRDTIAAVLKDRYNGGKGLASLGWPDGNLFFYDLNRMPDPSAITSIGPLGFYNGFRTGLLTGITGNFAFRGGQKFADDAYDGVRGIRVLTSNINFKIEVTVSALIRTFVAGPGQRGQITTSLIGGVRGGAPFQSTFSEIVDSVGIVVERSTNFSNPWRWLTGTFTFYNFQPQAVGGSGGTYAYGAGDEIDPFADFVVLRSNSNYRALLGTLYIGWRLVEL